MTRADLQSVAGLIGDVVRALDEGYTLAWVNTLARPRRALLRRAGVELLSEREVRRRGHRVRRGAVPVVAWVDPRGAIGTLDLFLFGVQTRRRSAPRRSRGPRAVQLPMFGGS